MEHIVCETTKVKMSKLLGLQWFKKPSLYLFSVLKTVGHTTADIATVIHTAK